jgi:hypothetical protein
MVDVVFCLLFGVDLNYLIACANNSGSPSTSRNRRGSMRVNWKQPNLPSAITDNSQIKPN